jgi:hypothetical protein
MIAAEVAANEARKAGETFVVASTRQPSPAVFVFACDHPDASNIGMSVMYELTPAGNCIRCKISRPLGASSPGRRDRTELYGA